jgi:hypothetical protein
LIEPKKAVLRQEKAERLIHRTLPENQALLKTGFIYTYAKGPAA